MIAFLGPGVHNNPLKTIAIWMALIAATSSVHPGLLASTLIKQITTDETGKTLAVEQQSSPMQMVTIQIQNVPPNEVTQYKLFYRFLEEVVDPFLLSSSDSHVKVETAANGTSNLSFTIKVSSHEMLVYNIWKRTGAKLDDVKAHNLKTEQETLKTDINSLKSTLHKSKEYIEYQENKTKAIYYLREVYGEWKAQKEQHKEEITRLQNQKLGLESEIEAYQGVAVDRAVREIRLIQNEIRRVHEELRKEESRHQERKQAHDKRVAELTAKRDNAKNKLKNLSLTKQIAEKNTRHENIENMLQLHTRESYTVLKIGAVPLGRHVKTVHYAVLRDGEMGASPVAMKRLGDIPILTQDDMIYALVTNHQLHDSTDPFMLSFRVSKGMPIDPGGIRPSFKLPAPIKLHKSLDKDDLTDPSSAYRDVLLPFGRKFRGNDQLKVTISTIINDSREETPPGTNSGSSNKLGKSKSNIVEFVKDEEYPQIRALYRYNFNIGFIASFLRDPTFIRSPLILDDIATMDRNEAEFETTRLRGDVQVMPVAALTIYVRRLDIQRKLTWREALTPNPTIGFSLTSPNEDLFLGFSNEVVRNTQLFYGIHLGKRHELANPNAPVSPTDSAEPATVTRFNRGFFIGLNFNMNILSEIFKLK